MALPLLETLGLTSKETIIYELLLQKGELPAAIIIAETKFKRATVYKSLYAMEEKGLVRQREIQKKIHFRPEPPVKLLELSENRLKEQERARFDLQRILPELTSSYILTVEKPVVRYFEGIEGVKQAHLEILAEKKEILAYVYINAKLDAPLDDFWPKYYKQRVKNNIYVRSISPNNTEGIQYKRQDKDQLRETRLIPKEQFSFTIEKNICGNKLAFFSRQEGKMIATIIENKEIVDTERAIFELSWQQAGHYEVDSI